MYFVGDEYRSDGLNVRRLFANVEVILVREPVLASGGRAALNGRSAAGKEHHDVFAVLRKAALVAGSETLAEADQQEQGTDTPGDAEHGEERTQLMRPEGAENLREDVDHHLHWGLITRDASLQFPVSQQTSLGATGGVGPSMIPAILITNRWEGGHRPVLDIWARLGRTRRNPFPV